MPNIGIPNLISDHENNELIRLPNLDEVKEAVFSINSDKTLGFDVFGASFFKNYWHIIKKDLFNCIVEFFTKGKILKEINHTFIALILKTYNPVHTSQFRPISLCWTTYKIISKILVNILRPLLVSPFQRAFIP